MLYLPGMTPDTLTVLGLPLPLSMYPRIIRLLPATSEADVFHVLSEIQVIDAPLADPVSLNRLSAELLFAPEALFQLPLATTPAVSELAIRLVPVPAKLTLSARGAGTAV